MKILLVDDNDADLRSCSRILESTEHTVITANCGDDALALLKEDSEIQVVFSDVVMPGMDGLDLLEQIRINRPEVLCAMLSGYGELDYAVSALRLGAFDFIKKPYRRADIKEAMERAEKLYKAFFTISLQYTVNESLRVVTQSRRETISAAAQRITSFCMPYIQADSRLHRNLHLSLIEAMMNAIVHGNLGVSSDAKNAGDWDRYDAEVSAREADPDYALRQVAIELDVDPDRLTLSVTDDGPGFDRAIVPEALNPRSLAASGRGILLMSHAMDEVDWNLKGNQVTMTKHLGEKSPVS